MPNCIAILQKSACDFATASSAHSFTIAVRSSALMAVQAAFLGSLVASKDPMKERAGSAKLSHRESVPAINKKARRHELADLAFLTDGGCPPPNTSSWRRRRGDL